LELLRSDLVDVILNDSNTEIVRFEYHRAGSVEKYEPDEIIYYYNTSVRNQFLGESLIASGVRSLETEIQISTYQANVIKNGGKPEMIIGVDGITSQEELERIEQTFTRRWFK
jgi:phage portal protein BeeE